MRRGQFREAALHTLERPEKIDRGGASFCERIANLGEFGSESLGGLCGRMQDCERGAHGSGDADCRCAPDDHFTYGFGDFAIIGVSVRHFLAGKPALVEHAHALFGPFDGLSYVHVFDVLTKSNCNQAGEGRRIGPCPAQCPVGMWVKPFVAMMEVKASMEL